MNNFIWQCIGHFPFVLCGLWSIYNGLTSNIDLFYRIGFILCGIVLLCIFGHSWYVGLTDPEYTGKY